MLRIRFLTDEDRIRGNYVLAANTVSRRVRGGIFERAESDRKLLDDNQLHYTIVPFPDANSTIQKVRNPPSTELQ